MWIKRNVVMLPTNEKANILSKINWNEKREYFIDYPGVKPNKEINGYNLYLLSDEKPEKNDWYIHNQKGVGLRVQQCTGNNLPIDSKKIIATSDKGLKDYGRGVDRVMNTFNDAFADYLPQPSQSFIEYFVFEYNKGNIITEVMAEYEVFDNQCDTISCAICNCSKDTEKLSYELKTNPDNTLSIKPVKDSWSKNDKDLIEAFEKFACAVYNENYKSDMSFKKRAEIMSKKWIEENL